MSNNVEISTGNNIDLSKADSNIKELAEQNSKFTDEESTISNTVPVLEHGNSQNSDKKFNSMDEGSDLYDIVSKLSVFEYIDSIKFSDGFSRKIDCFFIDKANLENNGCFHYSYGNEIKNISITQSISSYGINASIEIVDLFGSLTDIIEKQNNFYFVVSIFNITDENVDGVTSGFMCQPYIFEIQDVDIKSDDNNSSKIYQLKLLDIISSSLKRVSFGNFLLEYPGFVNSANFGILYSNILEYASKIIHYSHDKKCHINCNIKFIKEINDNINEFLKSVILKDLPITMTCYDLLNYIYKHAACNRKIPSNFAGENLGDVLIPLFLQDEIEDISMQYRSFFETDKNAKEQDELIEELNYATINSPYKVSATLIRRQFYCKDLLMPFELAFNSTKPYSIIYETINPLVDKDFNILDKEKIFLASNGLVFSPLESITNFPPNGELTSLNWKNLALISDTPSGASNMLIYFNWIYEFYKAAFLNDKDNLLSKRVKKYLRPIVDPHFHLMERMNSTGDNEETFAKINANTILLKSDDPLQEAFYHVGRVLKSLILMSSLVGFEIKGNLFRHPGEIIKINLPIKDLEDESTSGSIGNLYNKDEEFVLAYISSVSHIFNGSNFKDLIYANKICSLSDIED